MVFPDPPQSLLDTAKPLKIRKVDLFSFACLESTFTEGFSENEAKVYAGISEIHGMRYRAKKVDDKLYFFDEDVLKAYVKEVGVDLHNFLLARRFDIPLVALCGASREATMGIAHEITKRVPGRVIEPFMGWEYVFQEEVGIELRDIGVTSGNRGEFSSVMLNFARKKKFAVSYYRAMDTLFRGKEGLTVLGGIRIKEELDWAMSRKGISFFIKSPGGYYTKQEKDYAVIRDGDAAVTFVVDSKKSEEKAADYIVNVYQRSIELGFLKTE